jgi:hypothetical protein
VPAAFFTSSLLRRMGMSVALGLAPVICLAALFGIVSSPLPWVVAVSEVLRKVFGYAVLRPAREVSVGLWALNGAPLCGSRVGCGKQRRYSLAQCVLHGCTPADVFEGARTISSSRNVECCERRA